MSRPDFLTQTYSRILKIKNKGKINLHLQIKISGTGVRRVRQQIQRVGGAPLPEAQPPGVRGSVL